MFKTRLTQDGNLFVDNTNQVVVTAINPERVMIVIDKKVHSFKADGMNQNTYHGEVGILPATFTHHGTEGKLTYNTLM